MATCPSCGQENPEGFRLCGMCGASLVAEAQPSREERKVVTVVFADLVGFTSKSEQMDPEDVRALLSPYYARVRSELERFGGTVEKFIGDAVMALFGAPIGHEDDPERAVRAALAIRDWVREEERLEVRVAVNTGEALITLGARPAEGEGMAAGDVVNTAARLQSAAPVNGVLVGETTYRATISAIDYEETEPVVAKGKEEPLRVWEALQARAAFGVDVPHEARTALVGRERELGVMRDALMRVREERSPQLVTLVGVPGIGKSRLLYELSRIVDDDPELIAWRQGRSLPYGEGVSFWALAEMVKAQTGILETDTADEAEAKLKQMTTEVVRDATEAEFVQRHLGALLGLGDDDASVGADRRSEVFAAWRRFFEALAEQRPVVLVFEDLHWADDGLLDFVDYLVEWASGVPILVVASARPELLARRPGWGGGKPNATTLSLAPLSPDDSARLIGSLLGRSVVEADLQQDLLARAGGNPLYAEQYVQMLAERAGDEELPMPESIQGIIGARLDALGAEEKPLLQDAAVIGKVFWRGAVAALGNGSDPYLLEEQLHALERKEFIRRELRSAVAEETQYAFLHLLLRDVAYGQIPRTARIEKHLLAAGWIESLGRADDHAEMLAHHYLEALALARAAGQDTAEFAPRARRVLRDAGDRAQGLNAYTAAGGFYRQALELCAEDAREERADLLFRIGLAAFGSGVEGREKPLEQACAALLAVDDRRRAAEAEALLAEVWWLKGDRDRCNEHLEQAAELVRDEPPSAEKARVLAEQARFQMLAGEFDPALGRQALELAEALELEELRAELLITIGTARAMSGEPGGKEDVERGLELALRRSLRTAIRGYTNLAFLADHEQGRVDEALRLNLEAERVAERRGSDESRRWTRGNTIVLWRERGDWEECLRAADEFMAESKRVGGHYHDAGVLSARALIRMARDESEAALADQEEALMLARQVGEPQLLAPVLGDSAWIFLEAGRPRDAHTLAEEFLSAAGEALLSIESFMWVAERLGLRDETKRVFEKAGGSPWNEVARAILEGDFEYAAERLDVIGAAPHAALARLRAAEALVEQGRFTEADAQAQKALAFWRSVGATRYVRQGEALLAASA